MILHTQRGQTHAESLASRVLARAYLAPAVPHFANRPFASRHRFTLVFTVLFCATATGDFATAFATGGGHLMNLPLASLHRTDFAAVAAAFVGAGFVAAVAVVASASAAAADNRTRIIIISPLLGHGSRSAGAVWLRDSRGRSQNGGSKVKPNPFGPA